MAAAGGRRQVMAQRSSDAVRVPRFQPAAVQLIPWRVRRVGSGGAVPGWAMASAALSPLVMIGGWLASAEPTAGS